VAHRVEITPNEANRRLDKFLFAYLREAPHPLLYKLLRKKRIKLNSTRAEGHEMLAPGDVLDFYIAPETLAGWRGTREVAPAAALTGIVYEDEHLLIVDKPAGLAAHGGGNAPDDHLLARVLFYLYETGAYDPAGTFTPGLCNRLDTNTSGLTVCGKSLLALQTCGAMFKNHGFAKEYLAVVEGRLEGEATLTGVYEKDENTNTAKITCVTSAGGDVDVLAADVTKQVITYYKSLAVSNTHSLLLVRPLTGRSHQIRAHLAGIGFPLAGDRKYGGQPTKYMPAQLLHAWRLSVQTGPQNNPATGLFSTVNEWVAPLPEGFVSFLQDHSLTRKT